MPSNVLTLGSVHPDSGFCTHAFLLRGKTLEELQTMLGYGPGRLASGATILFLERLPTPDNFQLAGYTYFSDGAVQGHKLAPRDRAPFRMESLLKSELGWSDSQLRAHKQSLIGNKIVIKGFERLARLVPAIEHSSNEKYPPGSGVFQIRITDPLPFRVKAIIAPGQTWLGDYS